MAGIIPEGDSESVKGGIGKGKIKRETGGCNCRTLGRVFLINKISFVENKIAHNVVYKGVLYSVLSKHWLGTSPSLKKVVFSS